ncbi:MAG: ATP-binding protein [Nanoarchaeota archaeon]|nr:ATP-binding protein [Nanoarchaeota archaeon]
MRFFDRKAELEELGLLDKKKPSFLVVTGRRRVGKTELILHFLSKKSNIAYFFVDDKKNEMLLVKEYLEALRHFSLPAFAKDITTIDSFLALLFELAKNNDMVIAFDEFQRFMKISPSAINQLQKLWDTNKGRIFLLISGSSIGMIKKIFIEEKAPLFKRADNIITLQPFRFKQVSEVLDSLHIRDFEEKLKLYFLFGGTIYYYRLVEKYGAKNFEDAVSKLILRDLAPLKAEVRDIFVEEFGKEHGTYYEILHAISTGKSTKKEMADFVHVGETSLSPYIMDMKDLLGIISYKLPVTEPAKSKKGRYFTAESFFNFWFRFIYRNMSSYEGGDYKIIEQKINEQKGAFFGFEFEKLCMEIIAEENRKGRLPARFTKIGKWWGHTREAGQRKDIEIDIAAVNEREILFAECKWKDNIDAEAVLLELKEKAKAVGWNKGKKHYAIFAKSFRRRAKEAMCFDVKDLHRIVNRRE